MPILNTKVFTGLALALSVTLSSVAASPAQADDAVTKSRKVDLRGLDLTAPAGRVVLRHRLAVAAYAVCSDDSGRALNYEGFSECRDAALNQAWSKANALIASAGRRSLLAARPTPAQPNLVASAGPSGR